MNRTFEKRLSELSKLKGYQKPEKASDAIKLDSNENFAIKKEFQKEIIIWQILFSIKLDNFLKSPLKSLFEVNLYLKSFFGI